MERVAVRLARYFSSQLVNVRKGYITLGAQIILIVNRTFCHGSINIYGIQSM